MLDIRVSSLTMARPIEDLAPVLPCWALLRAILRSVRGLRGIGVGGLLLASVAMTIAADARTLAILPRVARARGSVKLAPGSEGSLSRAIAQHEKRIRWRRPVTEGKLPERDLEGTCPKEMSSVDDRFCVDRWEASLVEINEDGTERPHSPTSHLDGTKRYRAISAPHIIPQGYISGVEAESACVAAGKRLCGAAEWRFACAGSRGTVYPYGAQHIANRCNDHGRAPMYVFYPQVATSWSFVTNVDMNDPRLNLLEGTIAKTGEHEGCVNDWGLYDMVGNLHEWTSDPHGTFQGGYYLDTSQNGEGCAYRTTAHDFDYHDYSTGFRCCADLTPEDDDVLGELSRGE